MKHCLVKQEGRLYVIGAAHYESLVDLVQYYEKTPLYNKVENIILHIYIDIHIGIHLGIKICT